LDQEFRIHTPPLTFGILIAIDEQVRFKMEIVGVNPFDMRTVEPGIIV